MSYINHKYKHVFIHVPKTAGASMEMCEFVGGRGHGTIQQLGIPEGYFSWGFVRNPFGRLVSFHSAVWQHTNMLLRENIPERFEDLALNLEEFSTCVFVRPQTHFLCDKNNKLLMNFVGHFERLHQDWGTMCGRILKKERQLIHTNKTNHNSWRNYYTKESWESVLAFYQSDFETFYRSELNVYHSPLSYLPAS